MADKKTTQNTPEQTEDQKAAQARVEQGNLTADERKYEPVPDEDKPHPSTVAHIERLPGE